MILAVDLAARFSAGLVMDGDRQVHLQFDSLGRSPMELADLIAETAWLWEADHILVEDVPYGISSQFMVKPVLRLQGMVIHALRAKGMLDQTLFVGPATWQRQMSVFKSSPESQAEIAASFGYTPPDLLDIHASEIPEKGPERTKIRALLRKSATDYVSAYLIARWTWDRLDAGDLTEQQGVQPVNGESSWRRKPVQSTPSQRS